jgi:hypothetical protein
MLEIPTRRRLLETLLVQAMLEADHGFRAAAADYATAVLLMHDVVCDRELGEVAAGILRSAGLVDEPLVRFD